MALGFWVGAEQPECPLAERRPRTPDLLAVEQPAAVGLGRRRAQRRQVAARLRLRPRLRPDLLAAGHLRQHPVELLLGAVREQRRREHRGAVGAGPSRRAGAEVLLLVDHPLQQRGVAAAVLLGPGDHRQAGVEKHLVPTPVLLEALGGVVRLRRERLLVRGKEVAYLGLERQRSRRRKFRSIKLFLSTVV